MRIAHVVATFPPHIGGMGGVVFDEANALAKAGHDVTVFTMRYPGTSYSSQAYAFKVIRLTPLIKAGDAGWVPQLFFKLKGFDLVHLHYPWYGGAEWVWLASKLHAQKYVVTYHMQAAPISLFKKIVKFKYDLFLTKAILRGAAKVLVVDRGVTSMDASEFFNPVDTTVFQSRAVTASEVGLSEFENKKIILFVGNLMPVKRLDLAIEALTQMSDETVLVVVGGGYEEARYKKMVLDKNLGERVRFVGRIEDKKKLAEYYNCSVVTVIPSDAESFSLVAIESLASGTPVVASDIPAIRARIDDGQDGFLFTPGSATSLAEKLEKILSLSSEDRKQMGERGRVKVVEKYGIEKHVAQLLNYYKAVI